ncbi:DNA cytosine methyltransferase [Halobacillus sp. A5]|uniref:DNA cytosine methyltransferase n=1 Tax=Halobacillus sp. A5 TaxID=2880263 RepID=UPI0020A6A3C2|nr:DNA cytosine methyltransferase [Halobacillus sp. A5]MCP3027019.1 DNA cytosine methyltransferase [Halobacillus sp. A5]
MLRDYWTTSMKPMKQQDKFQKPYIVDLFAGCGGLSYGFTLEGLEILAGVDVDRFACTTASFNLHWKKGQKKEYLCEDIINVNSSDLKNNNCSVITVGGPPCQAYSRIGKAKLRSLGKHKFGKNDKRAYLYKEFIRLSIDLGSEAIVMENVPESVNFNGENIPQKVCEILEDKGYNAVWTVLNGADFGVPQTRERIFVLAIKKVYGEINYLPKPTHIDPNKNQKESPYTKDKRFKYARNFKIPLEPDNSLPEWVTTRDALSDLPGLFPDSRAKYVPLKLNTLLPYQTPPVNNFQLLMRGGKGAINNCVSGNSFRNTPRDFRIFEKMIPGDDYREAYKISTDMFMDACSSSNVDKVNHFDQYNKLKKAYVPPYDNTKFHSKWKRLDPEKPSHTLMAHLGTDTYSHIHPFEPRGISVREAARLQSFPDSFVFNTSMGQAYKQIGNAVPPLLAKVVARCVVKNLKHCMESEGNI